MLTKIRDSAALIRARKFEEDGAFDRAITELCRITDRSKYHAAFRDLYLAKMYIVTNHPKSEAFIRGLEVSILEFDGDEAEYFQKYANYLSFVSSGDLDKANRMHQDLLAMSASKLVTRRLKSFELR